MIAYYSKTLAPPERNYCVTRREFLAVVKAMKHSLSYARTTPRYGGYVDGMSLPLRWLAGWKSCRLSTTN